MQSILGRLQDVLGEMNDIAVGGSLVPSLAEQDPERARQRLEKLLPKAVTSSRKLLKAKPFWP
jgi:triphosphatase